MKKALTLLTLAGIAFLTGCANTFKHNNSQPSEWMALKAPREYIEKFAEKHNLTLYSEGTNSYAKGTTAKGHRYEMTTSWKFLDNHRNAH